MKRIRRLKDLKQNKNYNEIQKKNNKKQQNIKNIFV